MTTKQQPSSLTINVFKAYLDPLLTKHESGKVIVYEDLLASWAAVEAVLVKSETAPDISDVKEKIKALHDGQVVEYKKAGKRALIEYSRKCSLPAGDSSDPNHTLKCIRHALNGAPEWKLPRSTVLAILQKVIQDRLSAVSSASMPSKAPASQTPDPTSQTTSTTAPVEIPLKVLPKQKQDAPVAASTLEEGEEEEETPVEAEETAPASGDDGEIEEGEEAEEDEEEEMEDDAADRDNTEKSDNKGTTANSNRTKGLLARKKALGKTTTAPKKKAGAVKGARIGARGGGRIARRGGRGGGKA